MVKAQQQCPYCYTVITPRNFSMDHRVPLSRGGLHDIANVTICCKACNTAKGQLTDQEYAKLLHFLCTNYIQAAQRDILARLKAGARRFMRKAA
jgi:5-methylcytosine-specific restriction endonuclease McrA